MRSPRGWILKRIGVGDSSASPSTPMNAEPECERTSKSAVVNSHQYLLTPRTPNAPRVINRAA